MRWPEPQDYNESIQNPAANLFDAELGGGQPTLNGLGLPKAVSGNFASVYRLTCGSRCWAVKCFTRHTQDQEDRYAGISTYLEHIRLRYTVGFQFQAQGIRVQGKPYPIVKMEWVDGDTLDTFVQDHRGDRQVLKSLAARWIRMVGDLEGAGIAHGDLQHGNVLVVNDDFKLIDYDGAYVPPFKGRFSASNELGDPNYQHPARTNKHFDARLDRFSSWVIYLSLIALSEDPRLWTMLRAGEESLLLRSDDLKHPDSSSTIRALLSQKSGETASLTREVVSFLSQPPLQVPSLIEMHGKPIGAGWLTDHVEVTPGGSRPDVAAPDTTPPAVVPIVSTPVSAPAPSLDSSWLESAAELAHRSRPFGAGAVQASATIPAGPEQSQTLPSAEAPPLPVQESSRLASADVLTAADDLTVAAPEQPRAVVVGVTITPDQPYQSTVSRTRMRGPSASRRAARFGSWFAPFQLLAVLSLLVVSVLAFVLPSPLHSAPSRWLTLLPIAVLVNALVALHAYRSDAAMARGRDTRQQLQQQRQALETLCLEIASTEEALTSLTAETATEMARLTALRVEYQQKLPPAIEEINTNLAEELRSIDETMAQMKDIADREISQLDVNLQWLDAQIARIDGGEADQLQTRLLLLQYQSRQAFFLKNDLSQATIPGVPSSVSRRLFTLGLRTARDLTTDQLEGVPGVGDKHVQALLEWKRSMLNAAMSQAPTTLSVADLAAARAEILEKRTRLGAERQAALQRRNAEVGSIRAQLAAEMEAPRTARQKANAVANRQIAAMLDTYDLDRLDREIAALRARSDHQQQALDDDLARQRSQQAETSMRVAQLEAEARGYGHLTFKRFLLRIYTTLP